MNRVLLVTSASLLALATTSRACLQDRDSLETEARGVPDVMRALSGRFERNPPLFYQMRMQRVAGQIAASPSRLDLYDDISVAADRLNRDDEALAWIEKKRARLQVLEARKPEVREHWYRYYANAGTFRVHRWIGGGADRSKLREVKIARNLIAKAIAIKPGAHFGREKYQLKTMDWILYPPPPLKEAGDKLPNLLGLVPGGSFDIGGGPAELKERGYQDAERGLTGLITLGAAWQSIDVFNALRYVEAWRGDGSVVYLLGLRLQEMAGSGQTSLYPRSLSAPMMTQAFALENAEMFLSGHVSNSETPADRVAAFEALRAEADHWHERRTAFMLERLKAGRHPDTDASFWQGWDDGSPPALHKQSFWQSEQFLFKILPRILMWTVISLPFGIVGAIVLWLRIRKRRSKRRVMA